MDFILNEAEVEGSDFKLVFSDDEEDMVTTTDDRQFIYHSGKQAEDRSFYRDINNREHYPRFINQTRDPVEAVNEPAEEFYGDDDMAEMYDPEKREDIDFDLFDLDHDRAMRFKNCLVCFSDVENHFYDAIIFGIMYDKLKGQNVKLENAKETLGDDFFLKLKEVESSVMLDYTLFGYFDRCRQINDILSKEYYFLRFYERRNKFRFQLKKKLHNKNEMRRELLSCAIQKFNGYELLKNHLQNGERKDFVPIDVVYEPTLHKKNKTFFCFFAPHIHFAYHSGVGKIRKRKNHMDFCGARQCHYYNNYFVKSAEKMQKHLSGCAGKAEFTFSFNNGKIMDYQDNYEHLGDVPFSIYFDFETTTGNVVFFDAKMFVVIVWWLHSTPS